MSQLTIFCSRTGKSLAATVLGLTLGNFAMGQCLPAPPCPCAADGNCYPKRETWGNYTTNWRPWPGDSIGLTPTPAQPTPEEQRQLPIFLRPLPNQEDLRGPAKPTPVAAPAAQQPSDEQPAEAPANEQAPADDGLEIPGFGPQGNLQPLPQIEDGPPALPRALSQAATTLASIPQVASRQPIATGTATANTSAARQPLTTSTLDARYVTPTSGVMGANIELSNPAAAKVQKTMDQELQQAIYFEASDLP